MYRAGKTGVMRCLSNCDDDDVGSEDDDVNSAVEQDFAITDRGTTSTAASVGRRPPSLPATAVHVPTTTVTAADGSYPFRNVQAIYHREMVALQRTNAQQAKRLACLTTEKLQLQTLHEQTKHDMAVRLAAERATAQENQRLRGDVDALRIDLEACRTQWTTEMRDLRKALLSGTAPTGRPQLPDA